MIRRIVSAASRRVRRIWPRTRPAILMYHRVADESFDPWGLAVPPERFAQQMEWLGRNRDPLPLPEFARRQKEGNLSDEAVAITFDDGYVCSAEVAAPILHRLGIPATIFLPTELIRRGREFWWDDLERIVMETAGEQLSLNGETVRLGPKAAGDRNWAADAPPRTERQKAFQFLWSKLRPMRDADRQDQLDGIRTQAEIPAKPRQSHRPMSAEEARALATTTIELGSHGLTHPDLPTLSDREKLDEIRGSIQDCFELVDRKPRTFAYPYGGYDAQCEQLAAESGYDCACTAEDGFVGRSARSFALPRLAVGDWEIETFRRKLLGAL